ncbi:MAG: tRNA (uridine(34)/cytosine(34)/5-carboxymethylaminomethyluridine(34)-2'-O)-methyltransferase TrmL [Peptococcaceae bacterium]|nr:tRNA (uridine(34)/cytosine(34)/5-carboxymethylaminomethyluridine(34)-2'-O)-methyltransferase TrmL [Peptococcaceae bacterium]
MLHIVLVEPEIPANTGNIARTCAATGASLHLVRPLGFSTDDKYLKRAGLDYWHLVDIRYYDSFQEFAETYCHHRFFLATTRADRFYTQVTYEKDDMLIFGKETKGLSPEILQAYPDNVVRLPMIDKARSLNLGNSVAAILYEALRQIGFPGLR